MIPVITAQTTAILEAPEGVSGVEPLPVHRLKDGSMASVWALDADDREQIALGGSIALLVLAKTHPVVQLQVVMPLDEIPEEDGVSNVVPLTKVDRDALADIDRAIRETRANLVNDAPA